MIAALQPGQLIRVAECGRHGHVRTPGYLRGRRGRISEVVGAFPDPAILACGELGLPYRMLYRVTFRAHDLWQGYVGPSGDEIVADIYEHWLEASEDLDG